MDNGENDRSAEWFVPAFGTPRFRVMVGLLFLPYTGMVIAFTVIGAMLAGQIHWDRVFFTMIIYFLGLGIAAHCLDALGGKQDRPWGNAFTQRQLWVMAIASLVAAYAIAAYYMIRYVPLLWPVAVLEGFFVFAYNLEWFRGRFHTDNWFAFSWGFLPVLAGYIMQTNTLSAGALTLATAMALFSRVEIKASRPYKDFKQRLETLRDDERALMEKHEAILKSISLGVVLLGVGWVLWRIVG
jgi:hypothetical protein